MHEASLVKALLRQVAELIRAYDAETATRVCIHLGPLSGVEPELFHLAFERLKVEHGYDDCELELVAVPFIGECSTCHQRCESWELIFVCPFCAQGQFQILSGEAIMLENVELRFPAAGAMLS
jgi:hydrogenase nickel incorporation protein HypA/HybF